MREGTLINLGGVDLDDCQFALPRYLGPDLRRTIIRQPSRKFEELASLPYETTLSFSTSAEVNTAAPAHETRQIDVRVLEVRKVNSMVCEVHLGTWRHDVARRACPADLNIRFKDGYLALTDHPTFGQAVTYIAALVPELLLNLAPSWLEHQDAEVPDGLVLGGGNMLEAFNQLADACNLDIGDDDTGLGTVVARGDGAGVPILLSAFNWVEGFEPSWAVESRILRGLPRVIRILYPERHAILCSSTPTLGVADPTLAVHLVQVYSSGKKFLTLPELLIEHGFAAGALTDNEIARVIATENFHGTAVEPYGGFDSQAKAVVGIIKRDWGLLYRATYSDQLGRLGGWQDIAIGYFDRTQDKDGNHAYTGDLTARPARLSWTEWLARAEEDRPSQAAQQVSLVGAVVARSYIGANGVPPDSPYIARFEPGEDLIIRLATGPEASQQAYWPARMSVLTPGVFGDELRIQQGQTPTDDQETSPGSLAGLRVPVPSSLVFDRSTSRTDVFLVATRRLPNTCDRWFAIDVPAFEGGDVEVLEVEVGDELHCLRDYVSAAEGKGLASDGLGLVLNRPQLDADALRRAAIVKDRITAAIEGEGTCTGLGGFDMQLGHGVKEIRIHVDTPAVTTEVVVGNTDSEALRQKRSLLRSARRAASTGGKSLHGASTRQPEPPAELPIV